MSRPDDSEYQEFRNYLAVKDTGTGTEDKRQEEVESPCVGSDYSTADSPGRGELESSLCNNANILTQLGIRSTCSLSPFGRSFSVFITCSPKCRTKERMRPKMLKSDVKN